MDGHLFISYSSADAQEFAFRLHDTLEAGPPHIPAWLDKRDIQTGRDWDVEIDNGITTCLALLFVMTPDSVEDQSVCKLEWSRAFRYKKAVVPLLLTRGCKVPFRLESRQHIDFTGNFDQAMAKLRQHIAFLKSPAGELQRMKDQRADAQRDLRRADDAQRARIQDEMAQLDADIARLQAVVDDPEGAAKRQQASIDAGLERVRQPASAPRTTTKFINPPPGLAPDYFQDRHVETKLVADFINNPAQRLLTIIGRGGVGKTAMVCRLLKGLEIGKLPDDLGEMKVDGIVYLSAIGSRRVNFGNLYADLCRLLPQNIADELDALYREPQVSAAAKTEKLLTHFPDGRHVVLLDNMEDGIDPEKRHLTDSELDEALRTLLDTPHHGVKVIITTRLKPRQLTLHQPGRQHTPLELDEGLESPYAENILRAMDESGKLGLKTAPDALLNRARERTRGYPRALEALAAILAADREITLPEVLDADLPDNVVEALVGQAFSRLDTTAQRVMQALAIYGRPVPPVAVDYLLQPYQPGMDSAGTLGRLVGMHFARREAGQYFLHPVDQAYALERIPKGDPTDRYEQGDPLYTRYALYDRAADYFAQSRKPREEWKTIGDLAPQLAEIDLRIAGEDYDTAARVLLDIDYDYLLLWGQYKLMIALHERLQGNIGDKFSRLRSLNSLALASNAIGQVRKAIEFYEAALPLTRELNNKQAEGAILCNLGIAYKNLGEVRKAIPYYEQALQIDREIGDKRGEGADLGNLGIAYKNLGEVRKAITYYEQALLIARDIGDKRGEGADLGNLGIAYYSLGDLPKAIEYYEQSLLIKCEIGDKNGETSDLGNLAEALIANGDFLNAIRHAESAIRIAEEIGNPPSCHHAYWQLATAHLLTANSKAAWQAIQVARAYDVPENNHNVYALVGVIAARLGDWSGAVSAFQEAVTVADEMLAKTAEYYDALDAKGLALAGLAVCAVRNPPPQSVSSSVSPLPMFGEGPGVGFSAAIEAYRAARAIICAKGIVNRVLRLHDELAVVAEGDAALMAQLAEVRKVAAGEG